MRQFDKTTFFDIIQAMVTATGVNAARAVELFHALSDETRLEVLEMLRDGERCVCELQADLDTAQSRLSFHLKVLKDAGLVDDRKEGRWSYYRIVPDALAEVHDLAAAMRRLLDDPGLRRRLADAAYPLARAHTWARTAERTVAVYRAAIAARRDAA